jgi:hypothetical protein
VIGLVSAAALAGAALGGCTDGGVATLRGKNPAELTEMERAKLMAACLADASIGTRVYAVGGDDHKPEVEIDTDQPYTLSLTPDYGVIGFGGETSREQQIWYDRWIELTAKYDPTAAVDYGGTAADEDAAHHSVPYLFIEDEDHSETLQRCLDESHYAPPDSFIDPAIELGQKRLDAEATVRWLECARANGYPNLKDPAPPKADQSETWPKAVLPAEITEDALRALLARCPNFDPAYRAAADQERTEHPRDYTTEPNYTEGMRKLAEKYPGYIDPKIGFDVPGYDGQAWTEEAEAVSEAERERLSRLEQILGGAADDYWEPQIPESR